LYVVKVIRASALNILGGKHRQGEGLARVTAHRLRDCETLAERQCKNHAVRAREY